MSYSASSYVNARIGEMIEDNHEPEFNVMSAEEMLAEAICRDYVDLEDVPIAEISPYVASYALLHDKSNAPLLEDMDTIDMAEAMTTILSDPGDGQLHYDKAMDYAKEDPTDSKWLGEVKDYIRSEVSARSKWFSKDASWNGVEDPIGQPDPPQKEKEKPSLFGNLFGKHSHSEPMSADKMNYEIDVFDGPDR